MSAVSFSDAIASSIMCASSASSLLTRSAAASIAAAGRFASADMDDFLAAARPLEMEDMASAGAEVADMASRAVLTVSQIEEFGCFSSVTLWCMGLINPP